MAQTKALEAIRALFAEKLGVDPHDIDDNTDLAGAGLTSKMMDEVIEQAGALYGGLPISSEEVSQANTPEEFAGALRAYLATRAITR